MEETPKDTEGRRVTRDGSRPRQNGPAIRAIREKDGWTQTALAKEVGIRQATLSDIETESADTTVVTLNRIARKLRVPVAAIMRDREEEDAATETEVVAALCPGPVPSGSSAAPASPAVTPTPSCTPRGSSRSAAPATRGPR